MNLPIWQIKNVEVRGTKILSPQEIEALAAVPINDSLLLTDFERTKNNLKKIIAVKKFHLYRIPPGTVRIYIEERKPLAVLVFDDRSAIIDKEGYILNSNRNLTLDIPDLADRAVIFGLKKDVILDNHRIDPPVSELISGLISKLSQFYEPKKLQIKCQNLEDISLMVEDLLQVRLGSGQNISKKMLVFKRLLQEIQGKWDRVEYVDVRFPDSPVIKYK